MHWSPAPVLALVALVASSACGTGSPRAAWPAPSVVATAPAQVSASPTVLSPASGTATFTLSSPAVTDGRLLPEFRCEPRLNGVEASIPLAWSGVPAATGSLAVVMRHYPVPGDTSHVSSYLLLWGIDPAVTGIAHGAADDGDWFLGPNKDGVDISYTSPCSHGSGTHEYTITLYALSETPPCLPRHSSLEVTYSVLTTAISTVDVLGTATLTFTDTTP